MSLLAASLNLCVGHNSSGNISGDFCELAGALLSVGPGVKLREFPWRKMYPRTELLLYGKKIWNFVSELLLAVEKKKLRNCQACLARRAITFHVCSDFSSTAYIRVILWCVALAWHHCIASVKSYCAFLGPLLWLSCVKGFLFCLFLSFRVCSFHLCAWIEICQTWWIYGVKYLTSTVHWVLFVCGFACVLGFSFSLIPQPFSSS